MFILKHYDTPLLTFEMDDDPLEGQRCRILQIEESNRALLPIGMEASDAGLMRWLRGRIVPKNREYVDALLAKSGLSHRDTRGILRICRGLSLNDCYWVVEDGFDGSFADFNLYEHDFVKVLALIAWTGYGSSRASGFSSSPEFTTSGMLRKGWRRLGGRVLLYKGGTAGAANAGNEPYSEYYASQVAERMGLNHVAYGLSKWKGVLCSTCELFCDLDRSYVPIYRFVEQPALRSVAAFLRGLGETYYAPFADMLVFDALIYNEDRHFGNFGLMVDNRTNRPCAFAPLFDHGISLFNYAMPDDLDDLDAYAKTRSSSYGVPFENIVQAFISPRQKEALRRLIGFRFENRYKYRLPAKRLRAMERHLQARVQQLLEIPDAR
ncbi:MAG: XRE family transcriptional regulator [Oscillospiraceae bacterium]|nr:XRE family transcriptional regulator [Oscillospiraceae bacterium]